MRQDDARKVDHTTLEEMRIKLSQAEAKEAADWATEQLAALATKRKGEPK